MGCVAEKPALPLHVGVNFMESAVQRADQRLEFGRDLIERNRCLRRRRFDCERQPRHALDAVGHEARGQERASRNRQREGDGH